MDKTGKKSFLTPTLNLLAIAFFAQIIFFVTESALLNSFTFSNCFGVVIRMLLPYVFILFAILFNKKRIATGYFYWCISFGILRLIFSRQLMLQSDKSQGIIRVIYLLICLMLIYWLTNKGFKNQSKGDLTPQKRFNLTDIFALVIFGLSFLVILGISMNDVINYALKSSVSLMSMLVYFKNIIVAFLTLLPIIAVILKKRRLIVIYFISFASVGFVYEAIRLIYKLSNNLSFFFSLKKGSESENISFVFDAFMVLFTLWIINSPDKQKKAQPPIAQAPPTPIVKTVYQPIYIPVPQPIYPPYQPPVQMPRQVYAPQYPIQPPHQNPYQPRQGVQYPPHPPQAHYPVQPPQPQPQWRYPNQ